MEQAQYSAVTTSAGKFAQLISNVRTDNPSWIDLQSVARTATNIIGGAAAKIKIPPGFTLQAMSGSNFWVSNIVGGALYNVGRVITRSTPGDSDARYINTSGGYSYTSESSFADLDLVYPNIAVKFLALEYSTGTMVEFNGNTTATIAFNSLSDYVAPILQIRNNSDTAVDFVFGPPEAEGTSTTRHVTNVYFKLAQNTFLDSW